MTCIVQLSARLSRSRLKVFFPLPFSTMSSSSCIQISLYNMNLCYCKQHLMCNQKECVFTDKSGEEGREKEIPP